MAQTKESIVNVRVYFYFYEALLENEVKYCITPKTLQWLSSIFYPCVIGKAWRSLDSSPVRHTFLLQQHNLPPQCFQQMNMDFFFPHNSSGFKNNIHRKWKTVLTSSAGPVVLWQLSLLVNLHRKSFFKFYKVQSRRTWFSCIPSLYLVHWKDTQTYRHVTCGNFTREKRWRAERRFFNAEKLRKWLFPPLKNNSKPLFLFFCAISVTLHTDSLP